MPESKCTVLLSGSLKGNRTNRTPLHRPVPSYQDVSGQTGQAGNSKDKAAQAVSAPAAAAAYATALFQPGGIGNRRSPLGPTGSGFDGPRRSGSDSTPFA